MSKEKTERTHFIIRTSTKAAVKRCRELLNVSTDYVLTNAIREYESKVNREENERRKLHLESEWLYEE